MEILHSGQTGFRFKDVAVELGFQQKCAAPYAQDSQSPRLDDSKSERTRPAQHPELRIQVWV